MPEMLPLGRRPERLTRRTSCWRSPAVTTIPKTCAGLLMLVGRLTGRGAYGHQLAAADLQAG